MTISKTFALISAILVTIMFGPNIIEIIFSPEFLKMLIGQKWIPGISDFILLFTGLMLFFYIGIIVLGWGVFIVIPHKAWAIISLILGISLIFPGIFITHYVSVLPGICFILTFIFIFLYLSLLNLKNFQIIG